MALVTSEKSKEIVQQSIVPLIKEGLCALSLFADSLLSLEEPLKESDIKAIQSHITEASQKVSLAAERTETEQRRIDDECEELTVKKKNLQDEKEKKEEELRNLQGQLGAYEECEKNSIKALETAESHLETANNGLRDAEAKVDEDTVGRNVGIGTMFIPIIGPIVGSILVGVYQTALNEATETANEARGIVDRYREEVSQKACDVQQHSEKIKAIQGQISDNQNEQEHIDQQLTSLADDRKKMASVQEKMRLCTHSLSILSGRVNVLEVQGKRIIEINPLAHILEDIVQHIQSEDGWLQNIFQEEAENMDIKLKALKSKSNLMLPDPSSDLY